MSNQRINDSKREHKPRSILYIVFIILIIANIGILGFFILDFNLQRTNMNNEISKLNGEIETLQFQFTDLNFELSNLKDEIRIQRLGNASQSLKLIQIYNQTRQSVVLISVQTSLGSGQGSGFLYDLEGRIITNNHVVEDAVDIEVTFIDGTIVPASLVGRDPFVDLAVIDVDIPNNPRPLILGNSSELLVGEPVVAIGNPFGLADTMTSGIISAVGRQMDAPEGYAIVDVIQTDAAINPGNSGGPLLNMRGEVIGMNTAILSETQQFSGIGFAIPSSTIIREVPELIETGTYQHPYLGISGTDLTPRIAELLGLGNMRGALVVSVTSPGPAENAGVKGGTKDENIDGIPIRIGGDVIIGVDGHTIKNFYDLVFYLERYHKPGDIVELTVIRDNSVTQLQLTLGIRP